MTGNRKLVKYSEMARANLRRPTMLSFGLAICFICLHLRARVLFHKMDRALLRRLENFFFCNHRAGLADVRNSEMTKNESIFVHHDLLMVTRAAGCARKIKSSQFQIFYYSGVRSARIFGFLTVATIVLREESRIPDSIESVHVRLLLTANKRKPAQEDLGMC